MQLTQLIKAFFLCSLLGSCAEGGRSIEREIEIPPVAGDPYTSGRGGNSRGGMMGENNSGGQSMPMDRDQDQVGDSDDNCPDHYNPEQTDIDGDGQGDVCEPESD